MKFKDKLNQRMNRPGYRNHRMPVSRRDFIGLGLLAGGATLFPFGTFERAMAAAGRPHIPFLVFDLVGGASMTGNFLVGQKGGPEDFFSDYSPHGWNPRESESLNKIFGLPMSAKHSKMLQGLMMSLPESISSNPAQQSFKMSSFAHFSIDDTSSNRSSALSMISKSGLDGRLVKGSVGKLSTLSGGNSDAYLKDARLRPKAASTPQEFMKLTIFGNNYSDLSAETRRSIFAQLMDYAKDYPSLQAGYANIRELGVEKKEMDVRKSAVADLYTGAEDDILQGMIVYNVIAGNTGPGVITIDNCDYHDNTGTTGDTKDLEIGQAIGRAVKTASILRKPLMFQIITDGGVYAPTSQNTERRWVGDSGQHSLSVLGYFDPNKNVEQRQLQVGSYTPSGKVNQETFIGANPDRMAQAVLLNYLHLQGLSSMYESVAAGRLQANEIDQLLVFG